MPRGTHKLPSGMSERTPSTRLLEVIPLSDIPLLQNSGLVGWLGWVTPVHSRMDLLERGTSYWDILFFPIGSSRVSFFARPLLDVAASQAPSVAAAAAILYSLSCHCHFWFRRQWKTLVALSCCRHVDVSEETTRRARALRTQMRAVAITNRGTLLHGIATSYAFLIPCRTHRLQSERTNYAGVQW